MLISRGGGCPSILCLHHSKTEGATDPEQLLLSQDRVTLNFFFGFHLKSCLNLAFEEKEKNPMEACIGGLNFFCTEFGKGTKQ